MLLSSCTAIRLAFDYIYQLPLNKHTYCCTYIRKCGTCRLGNNTLIQNMLCANLNTPHSVACYMPNGKLKYPAHLLIDTCHNRSKTLLAWQRRSYIPSLLQNPRCHTCNVSNCVSFDNPVNWRQIMSVRCLSEERLCRTFAIVKRAMRSLSEFGGHLKELV